MRKEVKFSRDTYIPQPGDKLVGQTKWYRNGMTLEDSLTIEREVPDRPIIGWVYERDQFPDPMIGRNTGQWMPVRDKQTIERDPFREGPHM